MKKSPVFVFLVLFVLFNVVITKRVVRDVGVQDRIVDTVHDGVINGVVDEIDDGVDDRIVGGSGIAIEDVPYQVKLELISGDKSFTCGGSIISEEYVLTADHCCRNMDRVFIKAGSADANSGGMVYNSTLFIKHPFYNKETFDFDVCLIKVPGGMKLNGITTKAVKVVDKCAPLETGSNVTVTGWGVTKEGSDEISEVLRGVDLPIVSESECKKIYPTLTSRQFCAGLLKGGKDACQGDSGSPAVLTKSGKQIGVVSSGKRCAKKGYPGIYTFLANFDIREFIEKHAKV